MSLTTLIVLNAILDSAVAFGLGALLLRPLRHGHRDAKLSLAPQRVELQRAA